MSIEERLNLIGKIIKQKSINDKKDEGVKEVTIDLSYLNNENYKLRIEIECTASAIFNDHNARDHDFHWKLSLDYGVDDNEKEVYILGYGGSNVRQYDMNSYNTVYGTAYIELMPGQVLDTTLKFIIEGDDDSGNGSEYYSLEELKTVFKICGVLEI